MNAAYLRTSVWKEHKVSIEAQREYIDSAKKTNEEILYFEDRGFSGASNKRPSFQKLMKWVESSTSKRTLYVWRYDRLSRNVKVALDFLELCKTHQVEVVSVLEPIPSSIGDKSAVQMMFVNILFSLAEHSRSVTIENINQGMVQKKGHKKVLSAKVPFGYVYKQGKVVPNDSEAVIVKYIFNQYVSTTMGYEKIAKQLQRQGMTLFGKSFKKIHVFKILTNPIYMGEIGHKSKNVTSYFSEDITPIISRDLFEQATSKRLKRITKKKDTYDYFLRKKIICPYCDRKLSPKKQIDSRYHRTYRYYECPNNECTGYRINVNKIETRVMECVKTYLTKKDNLNQLVLELQNQLSHLENQQEVKVSQLNKQKEQLFIQFEKGNMSNKHMSKELSILNQQLDKTMTVDITKEQLEKKINHLLGLTTKTIQEILWSFTQEVYVTPDKQLKEVILYDIRIQSDDV